MIYKPEKGAMWDPSVFWHDGNYYAIMMYDPDGEKGLNATCGLLARSDDGVHWSDWKVPAYELTHKQGGRFFKAFIGKVGDKFVMDHGVALVHQDTLRYYESAGLEEWTYIGSNLPDPRWYVTTGRWDHMYILPKEEGSPAAGYWGYPVATPKPELTRGCGLTETADGRSWTILPPPEFDWGEVPPRDLEIGGVERIGGKYVMIGGTGKYISEGYSMYTLIADEPTGPFRPDKEAYRLCGTSTTAASWGVSFLAAWARGKGELLISNYVSVPSGTWMLPLRKPIFDDGHLRMGWWKENDLLKGEPVELITRNITLDAGAGGRKVVWLEPSFDVEPGAIIEGTIRASATGNGRAAGFGFSEHGGRVIEVRLGIGGPGERETHIGRYNVVSGFNSEDVTGAGCATVTGIEDGKEHTFRLLLRHDVFELYVDDLLMQTYVYKPEGGKVGLLANDASVTFANLEAWRMNL